MTGELPLDRAADERVLVDSGNCDALAFGRPPTVVYLAVDAVLMLLVAAERGRRLSLWLS